MWQILTYNGVRQEGPWIVGQGTATLSLETTDASRSSFFIAYVCIRSENTWKCGCRDQQCTQRYWQLQGYSNAALGEQSCDGAVSVMQYGATGDGVTDDTDEIEAALATNAKVLLPSGKVFIVDNLSVPSNKTICGYGATLKLKPFPSHNSVFYHNVVQFLATDNIALYGMTIDANRSQHSFSWSDTDTLSQNGGANAIAAFGSENIIIQDVVAKNAVTDGLLMGRGHSRPQRPSPGKYIKNWRVSNFVADNNGRQGISLGPLTDVSFEDCVLSNTNGRLPGFGVDIEPDSSSTPTVRLRFTRCRFTGNIAGLFNDNRAGLIDFVVEDSVFVDNSYQDLVIGGREGAASEGVIIRRNTIKKDIVVSSTGSNAPPAPHRDMLIEMNAVGGGIRANNITSDSSIVIRRNCVAGSITGFPPGTISARDNDANGCR